MRLKELREQSGLNQEGLAMKLSVSQSTISAYEIGDRAPDLGTLVAIAGIFHVSLDYLVGLSGIRHPIRQSDLSPDEINVLSMYRDLSEVKRIGLRSYLEGLSFE